MSLSDDTDVDPNCYTVGASTSNNIQVFSDFKNFFIRGIIQEQPNMSTGRQPNLNINRDDEHVSSSDCNKIYTLKCLLIYIYENLIINPTCQYICLYLFVTCLYLVPNSKSMFDIKKIKFSILPEDSKIYKTN